MSGSLISIEGLDGSGKATQTGLLCGALQAQGVSLRRISFPDYAQPSSGPAKMYLSGQFGEDPDAVSAWAASSFFAVDRCASYLKDWKKDYENGALIVADRYSTSNMVYQMPKLPRVEWDSFLDWVQDFEYNRLGLPKPDLTLYLDMPESVSQRLLSKRYQGDESRKDIHERNGGYLSRCREGADYAVRNLHWRRIPCARGDEPMPPEEIHQSILNLVKKELQIYA